MTSKPHFVYLESPAWEDYALLDSGNGLKLEQFGAYRFVRPKSQAVWQPTLHQNTWDAAHANFKVSDKADQGTWEFRQKLPTRWQMRYKNIPFWAEATPFRHMGVFPEQAAQWDWMSDLITKAQRPINVLNLFAYTGIASLVAAAAGAQVTHVDASKPTVAWARENQTLAGLTDRPIRWIVEDALKYVEREIKRGTKYDGFIMDPPPFGRGPSGEIWKFDKSMPRLLESCRLLMSPQPLFVVITTYTTDSTINSLTIALNELMRGHEGQMTAGTAIATDQGGRMLELATFARWEQNKA